MTSRIKNFKTWKVKKEYNSNWLLKKYFLNDSRLILSYGQKIGALKILVGEHTELLDEIMRNEVMFGIFLEKNNLVDTVPITKKDIEESDKKPEDKIKRGYLG